MAKYEVALVRFEGRGRAYPVNGAGHYRPEDKVVVEMAGYPSRLKEAQVVGRSISYKPCRHSIVGPSGRETSYLPGPNSVRTLEDLVLFVTGRNYAPAPVKMEVREDHPHAALSWNTAYICGYDPKYPPSYGRIRSDYPVLLIGENHLGLIYPSSQGELSLPFNDGVLVLGTYHMADWISDAKSETFSAGDLSSAASSLRNSLTSRIRDPSLENLPYIEGGL